MATTTQHHPHHHSRSIRIQQHLYPTPTNRTTINDTHTTTTTATASTTHQVTMSTNGTSSNGASSNGAMYLNSSRFLDLTHHVTEDMPTWDAGMSITLHYTLLTLYYNILHFDVV
jgi:hypothetical protein